MTAEEPRTAIVTCMDARLDAAGFLDLWPGTVHVVRNAGGRATPDVLRSLAASCAMGTERILVVHHTQCAMAEHSDEDLRALLPQGAPPEMDFLTIADPLDVLEQDVRTIRDSTLLPSGVEVRGFVYDLEARVAREV
ncbi:MAG: carbonic anhydrase [Solirubrobacterales bacterium]